MTGTSTGEQAVAAGWFPPRAHRRAAVALDHRRAARPPPRARRCPWPRCSDGRIDWVDGLRRARGRHGPSPCGPDTVFMVASCSKPVTAMLVLQQVERGVLDLDAPSNTLPAALAGARQRLHRRPPGHPADRAQPHRRPHGGRMGRGARDGQPVPTWLDLLEGRPPSHARPGVRRQGVRRRRPILGRRLPPRPDGAGGRARPAVRRSGRRDDLHARWA